MHFLFPFLGVYAATVDSQEQKVTVTGNIEVETLIKKLIRTGKHAELWPEKLPSKEKVSAKAKAMHKQKNPKKDHDFSENEREKSDKVSEDGMSEMNKDVVKSPENSTDGGIELPAVKNSGGENESGGGRGVKSEGKKKKRIGQKGDNARNNSNSGALSSGAAAGIGNQTEGLGMDQVVGPSNLSPTRQQSVVPFPQGFMIPALYASSYSVAYPREAPGALYYVPIPVYAHPSRYNQVNPLDSLYYFSDDNINGCFIM